MGEIIIKGNKMLPFYYNTIFNNKLLLYNTLPRIDLLIAVIIPELSITGLMNEITANIINIINNAFTTPYISPTCFIELFY